MWLCYKYMFFPVLGSRVFGMPVLMGHHCKFQTSRTIAFFQSLSLLNLLNHNFAFAREL